MVLNCWLVSCLSVTELFAGIHFRGGGGGGWRDEIDRKNANRDSDVIL